MTEAFLGALKGFLKEYRELIGERLTLDAVEAIDSETINGFIAKWQFALRMLDLGAMFSVKKSPTQLIETKMGVLSILDYAREIAERKIRLMERC